MKWSGILVAVFLLISVVLAEGEVWEEDDKTVLIRSERGVKNAKGNSYKNSTKTRTQTNQQRPGGNKGNKKLVNKGLDETCRYEKGQWSECDPKTNMRSRTLTLKDNKKKDGTTTQASTCDPTKTVQKKCKKACRYEKGTWSPCNSQNQMVRIDTLKEKSDPSCEQKRETTKNCKNKGARANKANKGPRRNRQ